MKMSMMRLLDRKERERERKKKLGKKEVAKKMI